MIDLHRLRAGERVTMRYPSGLLQEAVVVSSDAGLVKLQVGAFVCECVGPTLETYSSTDAADGAWDRNNLEPAASA